MKNLNKYKKQKEIFAQTQINTQNMLHISLYDLIGSSKVRELIMDRDIAKFEMRKSAKSKNIKADGWDKKENYLHNNKIFVGNWYKRYPGVISKEMANRIKKFHGQTVPTFNSSRVGGFGAGELCMSLSYDSEVGNLKPTIQVTQNRRNMHVLIRLQNFFGCGGLRSIGMWTNTSALEWKESRGGNWMHKITPKLETIQFHTIKDGEKDLFCNRANLWRSSSMPTKEIYDLCGSVKNKPLLVKPNRNLAVPLVDRDWIVGALDADGSISKVREQNRDLMWTQKDKFMLEIIQKYFGYKGNMGRDRYTIDYNNNFRQIDDLFNVCKFERTDLCFKHNYIKYYGLKDLDHIRKLPEYIPGRAVVLYACHATGEKLPDQLLEVLDKYYPMELMLYYKELYYNIYSKCNIDLSLLPFRKL